MIVFGPAAQVALHAIPDARIALLGGAPLDGEQHFWWNFVSSSKDRIPQVKDDWKECRFPKVPGDGAEFIPLFRSQSDPDPIGLCRTTSF